MPKLSALPASRGLPPRHPGIQSNQFSNSSVEKTQSSPLKVQSSPMILETLPVGLLQCNCSILGDETTREAIVIDPGDDIEEILGIVNRHQLRVKSIVITHSHIDHIGGAKKLKEKTGAPVYLNEQDLELYKHLDEQAA